MTTLVEMSMEVACQSNQTVRLWRNQRRTLEKFPTHLAESLLHKLMANHLLSPPLLEVFQYSVERLDLSGQTNINAEWLAYVGGFQSLRVLKLSDCKLLTNAGLWHLSGLEHVEELRIDRCRKITNEGLEHILSLTELKKLGLSETAIGREGLSRLSVFTSLTHLDLGGLPVTDDHLAALQVLQELVKIDIWGSLVSNKGAVYLQAFPKLESVSLAWTSVSEVPVLPRLSCLDLSHCKVQSVFDDSGGLSLQQLFLSRATLQEEEQVHILRSSLLSGLVALELSGANLTAYSFLSSLKRIVRLDLSSTTVSDDSIYFLAESAAHLKRLDLSDTKVGSAGVEALVGHAPVLEHICLRETMIDDSVFGLLSTVSSLVDINVSKTSVTGVDAAGWSALHLQNLQNLKMLDLRQTRFTDKSCKRLGKLVQLKHLLLSAEFLTNKSLQALSVLPNLESLSFQGTILNDAGLRSFSPPASLQELDLTDCWLLSQDSLLQFSQAFPRLNLKHELYCPVAGRSTERQVKLTQSPAPACAGKTNTRDERIRYTTKELLELRVTQKLNARSG